MGRTTRTMGLAVIIIAGLVALLAILGTLDALDMRIAWTLNILAVTAYACMVVWFFTRERAEEPVPRRISVRVEPEPEPTPKVYYDFKGDIHDVIDVEGIGEVYARSLQDMGIRTTARLCFEDPERIATALDVPVRLVQKWQAMAQLAKVDGIGKQYAEALVRAGVDSIDALKRRSPGPIADQVTGYLESLDSSVLGQGVTAKRVEGWQQKAKPMRRVRQPIPES